MATVTEKKSFVTKGKTISDFIESEREANYINFCCYLQCSEEMKEKIIASASTGELPPTEEEIHMASTPKVPKKKKSRIKTHIELK